MANFSLTPPVSGRLITAHLFCAIALSATHAQAQTPADAGQILQQIEKERGTALPKKTAPQIAPAPQPMKPVADITVTVTKFQFAGNTLLSNAELAPVVAEYLNRPIGFAELQQAVTAVAEAYRKAGWVVRAYLPQQDIQNGIVTIQIVEAVFGEIKFEGAPAKRLALVQIQNGFEVQQPKGAPLNSNALERGKLTIHAQWQAPAWPYLRQALAVLVREVGF